MGVTDIAVPADIKAINLIMADDFVDHYGNYAPENSAIDWPAFVTNYFETLGVVREVDKAEAESIRDEIFKLAMIAATIEIEGAILHECHSARLTSDNFPVKYVDGVRRYGKLTGNTLRLVNYLMRNGLTDEQKRVILARYREQIPANSSTGFRLAACVLCLIEDTLLQSSIVLVPPREFAMC
jgi:hypothetical protein